MIRTSADIFNTDTNSDISISTFIKESFTDFLNWWYVIMPVRIVLSMRRTLTIIDDKFSISYIFKTAYIPWHRDYNFVGYFVGFFARLFVLIPGILVFLMTLSIYLIYLMFWIFIPMISVILTLISPFIY